MNPLCLTVVIATLGRPSLKHTLKSLVGQDFWPGDSIFVLNDGCSRTTHAMVDDVRGLLPIETLDVFGPNNDWGHTPRNLFLRYSLSGYPSPGYVIHIDDDDTYVPGAIARIRQHICSNLGKIVVWRQKDPKGNLVWHTADVLSFANISTATFAHPTISSYPEWTPKIGGDFEFISSLTNQNEIPVVWVDDVLVNYRFSADDK